MVDDQNQPLLYAICMPKSDRDILLRALVCAHNNNNNNVPTAGLTIYPTQWLGNNNTR